MCLEFNPWQILIVFLFIKISFSHVNPQYSDFFSVMIVCSPLNSPTTIRIINHYKHYRQTKILLIDIIGNVFNFESRLYKNVVNITERNDPLVLTTLSHNFKHVLNSKYHVEFSQYLNLKSSHVKHHLGNESGSESFCDLGLHNGSHYEKISTDIASCQREIKERCNNYTNEDIKIFCTNITDDAEIRAVDGKRSNNNTFNKQLVFSEHFNLFDLITSTFSAEKNADNHEKNNHPFDFIVLDFKSILNATNSSIYFWRPVMILEQDEIDKNIFTMHRALSEKDAFKDWILHPILWKCGKLCWGVIAVTFLILISLIFVISLSVGIAGR